MSRSSHYVDSAIPTHQEMALAEKSGRMLGNYLRKTKNPALQLVGNNKSSAVTLPPRILPLLINILQHMSKGEKVLLVPTQTGLTTREAAELLNVSHPFLQGLIKAGSIPSHKVRNRRYLLASDVFAYKTAIDKKRVKSLAALTKQSQKLKMGY